MKKESKEEIENEAQKCRYNLTDEQKFELIKEGFLLEASNTLDFDTFSKMNYVYADNIYAKHYNKEVWRIVYLGQPSIIRHLQGQGQTCGGAYGYPIKDKDGGQLKHVKLGSIKFLNNYEPTP
tara:strand:+ start:302 stop:670 length:369 start_codon:yes stop_codon:yes gene_type:complete